MTKSALFALCVALLQTGSAADVRVSLLVPPDSVAGSQKLADATVIAARIGEAGCSECMTATKKVLETRISEVATLELDSGRWRLSAVVSGFWSEPLRVDVVEGAPEISAELMLWPTANVEGQLVVGGDDEMPEELVLDFHSAPDVLADDAIPEGAVPCPVQEGKWHCEIPAGTIDLRLSAKDFQSHYLWGLEVPVKGTLDLGALEFQRGSSVDGWVVSEAAEKLDGVKISLRPRVAGRLSNEAARSRIGTMRLSATTNDRGFFHIDSVPPGDYVIEASKEAFAMAMATVRVHENEATLVNNPPLVLSYPQPLEVHVDPPMTPTGDEWTFQLLRLDMSSTTIATIEEGTVPEDGMWRHENVAPGRYRLRVGTDGGDIWYSQEFQVTAAVSPIFVQMPVVEIRGEVRLGDMPLAAAIEFRDLDKTTRVELESTDEGMFEGFLPYEGRWDIYVENDALDVHRSFQKVEVKSNPVKGHAHLELRIPDTRLTGVTVQGDLRPTQALVTVQSLDEIVSAVRHRSNDEGRFEFVGLPPGRATVIAEQSVEGLNLYSREIEVELVDGQEQVTRLVLENERKLEGQLVARGSGVPGARIKAEPVGVFGLPVFPATSDAQGQFQLSLPRQTHDVLLSVFAPGFAFRILRINAAKQELTIPVTTGGGTLVVEAPEDFTLGLWSSPKIYILHAGAFEALDYLLLWAAFNGQRKDEEGNKWTIPMMEAGEYSACLLHPGNRFSALYGISPDSPCATGYLSESSVLVLSLSSFSTGTN